MYLNEMTVRADLRDNWSAINSCMTIDTSPTSRVSRKSTPLEPIRAGQSHSTMPAVVSHLPVYNYPTTNLTHTSQWLP